MDRLLNYTIALILIYIFALWAPASIHGVMIIGVIASLLFCSLAFIFGWLTLDGAAAAIVVGTTAFGFGGWPTAAVVIFFFLSSTLISVPDKVESNATKSLNDSRRDGLQVWANGFWLVIWLLAGILTNLFVCWVAAITVIATATADTWATELGSRRFKTSTYLATTFRKVPAGTEGGVSWPGVTASLFGSLFIGLIAAYGFSMSLPWVICVTAAGLIGSLLDSVLGATFQDEPRMLKLPGFKDQKNIPIDNNLVNWMSTGLGSLTILILNQVFI